MAGFEVTTEDHIADKGIVVGNENNGMVCFGWPEIRKANRFFLGFSIFL